MWQPSRGLCLGIGLPIVVACAWLATQLYLAKINPAGPARWLAGPPASALTAAAQGQLELGLERLNDRAQAPRESVRKRSVSLPSPGSSWRRWLWA